MPSGAGDGSGRSRRALRTRSAPAPCAPRPLTPRARPAPPRPAAAPTTPPRSEARARKEAEEFEQLAGDYLFSAGGGGLQSEWSDGFRAVRSLKYGTDENFSDLYKKVIFVSGLPEAGLPDAVRAFLDESRAEREGGRGGGRKGRPSGDGGGGGGGPRRGSGDDDDEDGRPMDEEDEV
jgi:hypothetical protein